MSIVANARDTHDAIRALRRVRIEPPHRESGSAARRIEPT
jgi:hypothetical protein